MSMHREAPDILVSNRKRFVNGVMFVFDTICAACALTSVLSLRGSICGSTPPNVETVQTTNLCCCASVSSVEETGMVGSHVNLIAPIGCNGEVRDIELCGCCDHAIIYKLLALAVTHSRLKRGT